VLTIENTVTFTFRGSHRWNVDANRTTADEISAEGITIGDGALFSPVPRGNAALLPGTVFRVIDNTGGTSISGTFNNLPDGSTISAGKNIFQANYHGGDGNALTLTVVP
jgi:hypothetical protein